MEQPATNEDGGDTAVVPPPPPPPMPAATAVTPAKLSTEMAPLVPQ